MWTREEWMFWWLKRYLKVLRHKIPQILTDLLPKTGKLCSGSSTLSDRTDRAQFLYFEGQIRIPYFACKIRTKYGSSVPVGSPENAIKTEHQHLQSAKKISKLQGVDSMWRCYLTNIGNSIMDLRPSANCLIYTMGFPILVRWHLYIGSGPLGPSQYWDVLPV